MSDISLYKPNSLRVAIVVHAFYAEQFSTIVDRINQICAEYRSDVEIDVHITINDKAEPKILSIISNKLSQAIIHVMPDYGMDIFPFFKLVPYLQNYDWVLKLQTKNCKDLKNRVWFERVRDGLIGSPEIFYNTVDYLQKNPKWCMAGLMPFYVSAKKLMLGNEKNIERLASIWKVKTETDWGFFAGTMFWLKPCIFLQSSQNLIKKDLWFNEDFRKDGLLVHAVERLITKVALESGEIGLLLPPAKQNLDSNMLVYSDKHKFAISKVFMGSLLNSYIAFDKELSKLQRLDLLDLNMYSREIGVVFENKIQAYQHFLLIGRFNTSDRFNNILD